MSFPAFCMSNLDLRKESFTSKYTMNVMQPVKTGDYEMLSVTGKTLTIEC